MSTQWLVLDVGNTHTVAGFYDTKGARSPQECRRLASIRFRTDRWATSDEYASHVAQLFQSKGDFPAQPSRFWKSVDRVILSTVVPQLENVIAGACPGVPLLKITSSTERAFSLDLPFPEQLGADRLANVAGALTLARGPLLIVDAGTATTFCLVDARPAYIGGAIVPGMETSWKALQDRAAKLFSVELNRPETSLGNTTESQLQSGVLLGYEALIEGLTDRLLADAARLSPEFESKATLFATGGCTEPLRLSRRFRKEPDLTLIGLLQYGLLTH